jgi:dynein heavy chain
VALSLDIPTETFDEYFTESLERARSAGIAKEEILAWLSDKHTAGSSLFFAATRKEFEKEIEEEVEVEDEEASEEKKTDPEGDETAPTEGEAAAEGEKAAEEEKAAEAPAEEGKANPAADGEGKEGENKDAGGEADAAAEVENAAPAPAPAPVKHKKTKMIIVKRLVKVYECRMMMGLNQVTPEMNELPLASFMRSQDGEVPSSSPMQEHLEFNYMTSDYLFNLANLIKHVYMPAIDTAEVGAAPSGGSSNKGVDPSLRNDLGMNMDKFYQQLNTVAMQNRGDVSIVIPNIIGSNEGGGGEASPSQVSAIEAALEDWTVVISNAVESEIRKDSSSKRTPLEEIEFWRSRAATLSPVHDQIGLPKVQQILDMLQGTDNAQLSSFNYHYGELTKTFLEAKDNVKFLTTLERHFKHIADDSFGTIIDSMLSMVNGLRQVWVISRHYNTDDKMAPLMEAIAESLGKRVREGVKLSAVLGMEFTQAHTLLQESKDVLSMWSENYFRMRKRIEDSGSDHRWEFDRKALFGKTDYMCSVCNDIIEVLEALDHFRIFLGPELKQVTGDSGGINEILKRVKALTNPFKVPFEEKIFEKTYEKPWETIMKNFRESVEEIETMTESFIEESFSKLRSAELAFELVGNFQRIGSDDADGASGGNKIKAQISARYDDILNQYLRELDSIQKLFEEHQECPPLSKNYPPVAGAVSWARDLYHRAKRPILKFKNFGGLLDDALGESVKQRYLEFARQVDAYITELYNEWEAGVSAVVVEKLRLPVLRSISSYPVPSAATGKDAKKDAKATTFALPPPPYRVNFAHDLKLIIKESRYFDKMGFRIPEAALNMTLQETKYLEISRSLNAKLHDYDNVLKLLKPIEKQVLKPYIDELNHTIKVGFYPLNWTSQRIPDYIVELENALVRFGGVVSQLQKNAEMIEAIIARISSTLLVQGHDLRNAEPGDATEICDVLESKRAGRLEGLVEEYKSIGDSFLMKVEEVVARTTTGASPVLSGYYFYWEKQVYNAIAEMIISSLATLRGLIMCKDRAPLFKVIVSLNGKELSLSPVLTDVDKLLSKVIRGITESSKSFVRWMHGTCILTEPQVINDDDEPFVFSYYQDISQNPEVIKLALSLTSQSNTVYSTTNKYLDGWRRYDKVIGLWDPNRKQQIEKLRPTCSNLDSAMCHYQSIKDTVNSAPTFKDIEFLQVDTALVAIGVAKQAEVWKLDYGEVLHATSQGMFQKLSARFLTFEENISKETDNLEDLKFVLNNVADITAIVQDIELEMMDVGERYRTLLRYNSSVVDAEELKSALSLNERWHKLYCDSRTRDLRLVDTKAKFRVVTAQQDVDFREELELLRKEFLDSGPGVSSVSLDEGVGLLATFKLRLDKLNRTKIELVNALNLFDLDVKPYTNLQVTMTENDKLEKIYDLYCKFLEFKENMSSIKWNELEITSLQKGAEDLEKEGRKFPKELKEIYTFKMVEKVLANFKEALPLVVNLKNDSMKGRHWQKVMDVTSVQFDVSLKGLTLGAVFEMELHKFAADVEEIINESAQEAKIENEVAKIDATWRDNVLGVMKYKKDGVDRGLMLKPAEELKMELEDNMLNIQTISASRFVGIFIDKVKAWEKTLNIISECLEVWFTVQRKWAYLEGIFIGAEDIRMQLPEEAKRFDGIDKAFKAIMSATAKNPNVVDCCTTNDRLENLTTLGDRLDSCQKSLSDYLNTKRTSFPRFFFISDDELLSVLGSSDPTAIQIHLLKLFDNVKEFTFGRNNKIVEEMTSSEKESFSLITPANVDGAVESWMTGCEDEMHVSLRDITKEGVFLYAQYDRCEWLSKVLGMVGLVGSQIWWTWEVEDTFRQVASGDKYAMKSLEAKLTGQLNDLVAMVRDKLDKITRKKVNTLLIIDVHARDIVDGFVRESVLNAKEFAWESQLRFYWDKDVGEDGDCVIRQCTGKFRYGYEYMGLNGRLVITPLTDRCYMTLTQALTFKLGGSPAGPAGTGKTETVKDLAKSLALPCFVINCGDGLDYKAMGSIFGGLVRVGAWGCFDEFNRINIEVLSVVSAQLRAIQNALLYDKLTCDIGTGGDMVIKRVDNFAICGIFITMNPGYAGRTELPDNLKALFRPVTMIVPDFLQICEIMLFSEGFELAKGLAKKMTVLYQLSKEQLSKQYHYDFGLRALKSVLVMAGGLKRAYQDMSEDLVLMRCLRDSNLPKFVFEDVPLFLGLIGDLFPGLDCPRVGYENLKQAAMEDLEARGYKCSEERVFMDIADKVIQMFETQLVRHTTMIVGPTGGGKSLVLETLKNSRLVAMQTTVKMYMVNPKAQPLKELYGEMDPVTRDWTDGILSKLFRECNEPLAPGKENEVRWIIYDGDVDALWVENMNSVMDDNRLLTLPNGERIRLQAHCAMIMETFDLQYASPATISRCGMVWVDPKNLGYRPFYERWVRTRFGNSVLIEEEKQEQADRFMALYEKYVPKSIDMILAGLVDGEMGTKLKQVIPITNIDMLKQLCSVIDAYIPLDADPADIEYLFIFACVWSLGGALVGESRIRYDAYIKKVSREALPDALLYEYYFSLETHKWEKWQSQVPDYAEPSPFRFYEVMVPTSDSVLYSNLLSHLAPLRPILFVGESGTAKTSIISKYLSDLPSTKYGKLNINFSSRTTSADTQTNIEANVDKRSGSVYGPPTGKKLIVFIDDMNMPKVDTYGTQQPIALLHYVMNQGKVYDREKLDLKTLKDLQYIGAMGPPGGGRNPVDTRFVALFNVFNLTPPTVTVLVSIYSSIINTRFREFADPVKGAATKFTETILKLFHFMVERMPPTPSKFHYIFNLRDLSRVSEGMCNATTDVVTASTDFVRMFRNECDRVFYDRLTTAEDQKVYRTELGAIIKQSFGGDADTAMVEPSLFGDFENAVDRISSGGTSEDVALYKDLGDYDNIRKIFDGVLEQYNLEHKKMSLVLFENALEHLCRIHRIIRGVRGNALLVGVGGSGKQSLTALATYCAGYKLFQVTLSRGYGEDQFKDDLRELYKELGTGEVVFLFTDAHVVEEGFLEFINNMLTTGMVPALYEQDEKDGLANSVRAECKAAGIAETPDNLWNFYVNKCRNNLHIVLAMSPSGSKLRIRCRNFPGLVSNCVIDWFFPWPADALQKVAEFFLAEVELPEEHRSGIVKHLVYAHQNVTASAERFAEELRRFYYVTPKNYLDFINNYKVQLVANIKQNNNDKHRLEGGLQKLIEAAAAVDRMQITLTEKKVVVDAKTADVTQLIEVIQEKTTVANKSKDEAAIKQAEAEEQAIVINREKANADEALMEALPAVEAASRALENLDKNDLTELKAFASPPPAVKTMCMQLVVLRPTGEKFEEDWGDAKKMLGNPSLLNMLKNFAKDDLKEAQVKKVNKYFAGVNKEEALAAMKSVSKAGYGLLTWVVAIVKYFDVAKNVAPLREKVKVMEKAQRQTESELAELHKLLASLESELKELSIKFEEANGELTVLQTEASLMTKRLNAASQLIEGLTGERTRWTADVGLLDEKALKLYGDCLLGSSFLSYAGAFTADYRQDLVYTKFMTDVANKGIPMSDGFSLEGLLTTDATVQGWVSKGLPADAHSVQNGILTTKSSRFPLCIDPQQQAVGWIKQTYATANLTVKSLSDSDFMKHLELAIQFGNPFLFENIDEELDPMIDPILEKNVVKEGAAWVIKLGDKLVEWDDNFRLFFTTKLANPHYSPEIMGKTMIINYGVTLDGLANQLLNVVVGNERPDLELAWSALVEEMGESAQTLVSLEDTLLRELSSSSGNILDNQELIATLQNTKVKATEISLKLDEAKKTKIEIGDARSAYKPVAKRGSILYFAESGLAVINSMYEISLDSFLNVFKASLESAKKDNNLETRLRNMIDMIMRQIYDYTCTGIFEKHKLMFSFQMTCMIMNGDGDLEQGILDFFLKGDTSLEGVSEPNPVTWLNPAGWKDLLCLGGLNDTYGELLKTFKAQSGIWKDWYDLEAPETVPIPGGFTDSLTALQRLNVMRCFRPDRVYNAVKLFVMETLGEKFVQPPVLDYSRIYSQSSPRAPMVFILSPGADPQSDIQKFCDEMDMTSRFKFVALGQGQGPIAEQLLETGYRRGNWVLLQNCHLLASWLKTLERILNEMKDPHKDFRLWLTTDPTDKFPLGILQRSLKIVTEPPDGLKLNMRATYSRIDAATLEECPHWAFRPCLYVLTFLHAVVLERRKYGKIGWNVSYDFNDSDLNISKKLCSLYLEKAYEDNDEFLPWGSLKYLIGDAMYGGRVSDNLDRRVLKTYLEEYMGDFLFDDTQEFTFSRVGFDYVLPKWGELENYTEMVEALPLVNSPAVFGLHPNAEIGYYSLAVKGMWVDLISLQPRTAGGGEGMSREDYIANTAKDIFSKIPLTSLDVGSYDLLQTRVLLLEKNDEDFITPCQVVLLQELERWNNLVKKMAISLQDLNKALVGEIGMSDELDNLGDSLFNGFLPFMWRRLAPSTEKPLGPWMSHYTKRNELYANWINEGEPAVMWLSGLHIPESYLTALVQTTCRAKKWPLDKSTLYTVVTKYTSGEDLTHLESGCYVSGLYLEGAAWDGESSTLRPQDPKVLVTEIPIMQVIPIEASKVKLHNTFKTPVYVTQARKNAMGVGLVFEADLATTEHTSHWVLQGVALCLNIDT